MIDRRVVLPLSGLLACGALAACAAQSADDVGVLAMPLDACGETVPADRNVDGIPAYAQCDAVANSAVFSNNGVNTSLTSMGADWVKTQYSGGYQCTEFAHRYLYFKWQVKWIPNGNAGQWCDTQPPANSGLVQTTTPVHGDLMVLAPGSCGAAAGTGHVNVVDVVDGTDRLTAVEQNRAGRSPYKQSCGKCFLHVVANDGSGTGSVIVSGSGGAGAAGMGSAGTGSGGMGSGGMGSGGLGAAGTAAGSGGMASMPVNPSAQAGAAAPNPAPAAPAAPAPVVQNPAPAINAGTGGVAAPPEQISVPLARKSADTGCSVTRAGAPLSGAPSHAGLFVLAVIARHVRSRIRRSRVALG
jgi:surface antigen